MKLGSLLLDIGSAAIGAANPVLGASIAAIANTFFDSEQQVTPEHSGQDIMNRINLLPEKTKQELLSQDVSLQIQLSEERISNNENAITMGKILNNSNTASTIVMQSAKLVFSTIFVYGIVLACVSIGQVIAIVWYPELETTRIRELSKVIPTWETIATMLTVPTIIIYRYFGAQSKDNRTLTNGINGFKTPTTGEALKSIVSSVRPKK